ncbi:hypothetical protein A0H81_10888 [Grifola frondosa]|uniref:Protein kinase domain-containing protein n=1 Tax=Grifola frondosa TaxID=5627 RepID=A0A1C7LX69_GRIFR|nr:hypothetical protein A0H81_10888 [Grifola frondosa]
MLVKVTWLLVVIFRRRNLRVHAYNSVHRDLVSLVGRTFYNARIRSSVTELPESVTLLRFFFSSHLSLLYDVADSIPVVGLKPAVAVTLHILEIANQVKSNKDDCLQLANRAADIMCLVYEELKRQDGCNPENLQERINNLEGVLRNIEAYMERKSRERFLKRLFSRYSIGGDIQQFTVKLNDAVVAFQLTSMIDVSHTAAQIKMNLNTLAVNADQHTGAILAQIRVTDSKLDKIAVETVTYAENVDKYGENDFVLTDERWVLPGGELIQPVVKRFPKKDPRFESDLQKLRELWHPNIARVVGRSRSNIDLPFIIKECTDGGFPMEDLVENLTGYHLIAFNVKILKQIYSLSQYLTERGFQWEFGTTFFSIKDVVDNKAHVLVDLDWWSLRTNMQIPYGFTGFVDINRCKFKAISSMPTDKSFHFLDDLPFSESTYHLPRWLETVQGGDLERRFEGMQNAWSVASRHNVGADTICIARGMNIYIKSWLSNEDTDSCPDLPDTLYFFARSYIWSNEALDSRPWGYWSADENDFPSTETFNVSMDGVQIKDLVYLGWISTIEVGWKQVVNGVGLSISVSGTLQHDLLKKDEVSLVEEVDRLREICG